jgi:16S rRNA (uracil1498-N3)-methyltransferase
MSSKHEFALYIPFFSKIVKPVGQLIEVQDQQLVVRVGSVLRLKVGETVIFFDEGIHAAVELVEISKKEVKVRILSQQKNSSHEPKICFALPILKKDDFESALYSLVELGATSIQLITTEKIHRSWAGEKELERCQRIMIAAAEQSKNYAMPEILAPITLPKYLAAIAQSKVAKVYFDVDGQSALAISQELNAQKPKELILMAGPEADLTPDEKQSVLNNGFKVCALTPTVLKSVSAIQLGMGILRSVLR